MVCMCVCVYICIQANKIPIYVPEYTVEYILASLFLIIVFLCKQGKNLVCTHQRILIIKKKQRAEVEN